MDKIAKNIVDFCDTVAPYSYVLAVVVALIVGIMFALPSEKHMRKQRVMAAGVSLEQYLLPDA